MIERKQADLDRELAEDTSDLERRVVTLEDSASAGIGLFISGIVCALWAQYTRRSAWLFAAITPLLPDMKLLLENVLRGLFFLSGVFFDISSLSEPYASWLRLNPIATVIDELRKVLMWEESPAWDHLLTISAVSLVLITAGLAMMRRNESRYAKSTL